MKVGDLVQRKVLLQHPRGEILKYDTGIILSLQPGGSNPIHPCATVFYPKGMKTWDIAVSLLKVISETR